MTKENSTKGESVMFIAREESDKAPTSVTPGTSDFSQYPVYSLQIEGCVYRGEGNANLVIALPSERKVIRLRKSANTGVESSVKVNEEVDKRRVCRQVDFIKGVISAFLGCYVNVPEILRLGQPEIAKLSDKIRPLRPENRRGKDIIAGYATKFPDYTFLPEHLATFSSESTFCVEIKPKQGFICKADQQFQKCPYCLMQYYKIRTGSIKEQSSYCPLDLFSGSPTRTRRALESLLRWPQNNLKIFKNGEIVYDESRRSEEILHRVLSEWFSRGKAQLDLEAFLQLVECALARPFDAGNEVRIERATRERELKFAERIADTCADCFPPRLESELVERVKTLLRLVNEECELSEGKEKLVEGSVLERILRMQKLHRCGGQAVAWSRAKLPANLDDEVIYAGKDVAVVAAAAALAVRQPGTNVDADTMKHEGKKQLCDWMTQDRKLDPELHSESHLHEKNENFNEEKIENDSSENDDVKFLKSITIEDCLIILRNYLLFCTAKDCSILMAFQKVDKKIIARNISQHLIELSEDQSFLVSVRVLDLDMKSLKSIEKHCQRDKEVLLATIEELEKKLSSENIEMSTF